MKKEGFKLQIDGSFRFVFRKSLPLDKKEKYCDILMRELINRGVQGHFKIIKGVLVLYLTPNPDTLAFIADVIQYIDSVVTWYNY